jgi:mRNA-degrading endonuclease RelE of RelBE toxin-antitoxin system
MAIILAIMARQPPYVLAFVDAVAEHLRAIEVKHHSSIRQKIREQLLFKPDEETTNRKPLRRPAVFGATWEIRFGPENRFRVLYDIDKEARVVVILAIGEKLRERLFIGGEEVEL